jgi:hypothetical protein
MPKIKELFENCMNFIVNQNMYIKNFMNSKINNKNSYIYQKLNNYLKIVWIFIINSHIYQKFKNYLKILWIFIINQNMCIKNFMNNNINSHICQKLKDYLKIVWIFIINQNICIK